MNRLDEPTGGVDAVMELHAIKARAAEATEGPWRHWRYGCRLDQMAAETFVVSDSAKRNVCFPETDELGLKDAEFIAHSRTDIPDLVAAVEAVLAIHTREADGYGGWMCATCLDDERGFDPVREPWPCDTVEAIRDALGEKQ